MINTATSEIKQPKVHKRGPYNKVTTNFKLLSKTGILTVKELASMGIPPSTYYGWKSIDFSQYIGMDRDSPETLNDYSLVFTCQKLRSVIRLLASIIRIYRKISKVSFKSSVKKCKELVVNAITKAKNYIKPEVACRFFHISVKTFYSWAKQVVNPCLESVFKLCRCIWPNQLTPKETAAIKTIFSKPRYMGWPLVSIYYHAFKNKVFSFSLHTFYKYSARLGFEL
ncbi:MAG: hypothetical protein JW969_12510 [Spirochaetales bacterium]|nr:hypothetical protein [Spirochaetales bacterium]